MRFKIDWASLIVESFAHCFTLYLRAIFQVQVSGGLHLEGRFNGGFFALPVWGAYSWRGLFSEFYGNYLQLTYLRPCSTVWKCKRNVSVS